MGVTSQKIQRVLGPFNSIGHNLIKSLVIATFRSSNMKAFARSSLVFFIVAITIIAMAKAGIMGVCKEWAEKIGKCSKGNEAEACCREQGIPDYCFGYCLQEQPSKQRQMDSVEELCNVPVFVKYCDQIKECFQGSEEDLLTCCKNKGVPYEASGNCRELGGEWEKWEQIEFECRQGNEGKKCCEDQGVPEKYSAYCEAA